MENNEILFLVIVALSVLFFLASICVVLYYKRKKFETKGDMTTSELAKRLATISIGINIGALISFVISLLLAMILPPLMLMGIIIAFVLCGVSIVIGPALSLLGIVFSYVSIKAGDESSKYMIASGLSMLCSVYILSLYVRLVVA